MIVVAELMISNWDDFSIPYLWGIIVDGKVETGRGLSSFLSKLEDISKGGIIVYMYDLKYLYGYIEGLEGIGLRLKIEKEDGTITSFHVRGITFKSISALTCDRNRGHFNNIDVDYERRLKHDRSVLDNSEYTNMSKMLVNEYSYIKSLCEEYKGLENIPKTRASIVQLKYRSSCFGFNAFNPKSFLDKKNRIEMRKYQKRFGFFDYTSSNLHTFPIFGVDHYKFLKKCFVGGYCGYNLNKLNHTIKDVKCYDFTSSYPTRLLEYKYPTKFIGRKYNVSEEEAKYLNSRYWTLLEVELSNLELRDGKCCAPIRIIKDRANKGVRTIKEVDGLQTNERFVIGAKRITLTLSYTDLISYSWFYKWDSIKYNYVEWYYADYLPVGYQKVVLDTFINKSLYKGEGSYKEITAKAECNISWGLFWSGFYRDIEKDIKDYNRCRGVFDRRTSDVRWAIACTSYARRDLLYIINELGNDWDYSDSDSVYFENDHNDLIDDVNLKTHNRLSLNPLLKDVNLNIENFNKTRVSTLGKLTFDGSYKRFKTIGCKTYLCQKEDDSYKLVYSGLSDFNVEFLNNIDAFKWFDKKCSVPAEYCTKCTGYTSFGKVDKDVIDYKGVKSHIVLAGGYYRRYIDFKGDPMHS